MTFLRCLGHENHENHDVKYIESEHDFSIMMNKYVNYWDILDLGSGMK